MENFKKHTLFFLTFVFFIFGCEPRSPSSTSIDLALDIPNIENGLSFDLHNINLKIYYGLYMGQNSSPNSIVKCQFKSYNVEYTFFIIDELSKKDYSFSKNSANEIEYNCFTYITIPSTLFTDDFGTCMIGLYFYDEDSDYSVLSKGIAIDLEYEKHDGILNLIKGR